MAKIPYKLIIHGGAWDIPPECHDVHLEGIESALREGRVCLEEGLDAVTTVVRVIMMLENDPTFDAGTGSFLNQDGEVEMDAMIMDGRDLSFGAVAAIQNVQHPICVADKVRRESDHCFLVGQGADKYAHRHGFDYWPTENLLVGRELDRYQILKQKKTFKTREFFEPLPGDTVGAVVMDINGNMASATSTGGTPNKISGRVGDSPVIGAGTYADNQCGGASSTGWGESIMKVLLAKTTCDFLVSGQSARAAADSAIHRLSSRVDGLGGVICLNAAGEHGYAYNTPYMARGVIDTHGIQHLGI